MAENTNHDAVEGHYKSEDAAKGTTYPDHDVQVVYVRRKGLFSKLQDVRSGIRNAGRRWIEFSVCRLLNNQDKVPRWMDTRGGRWILAFGVVGMLFFWVVIFVLTS